MFSVLSRRCEHWRRFGLVLGISHYHEHSRPLVSCHLQVSQTLNFTTYSMGWEKKPHRKEALVENFMGCSFLQNDRRTTQKITTGGVLTNFQSAKANK
jgi:hypothetical protein